MPQVFLLYTLVYKTTRRRIFLLRQILEETCSISLHSKEIYIMEVSFVPLGEGDGKPVEASAISFDLKLSTATFSFPTSLAKGTGTLKLTFQCDINNQVP